LDSHLHAPCYNRWAAPAIPVSFKQAGVFPAQPVKPQALTAIIKLDYSAKPIFPELALLAQDADPKIKAAASFALGRPNPAEFSRLERLQSGKK
jgi:hypothetical protein